MLYIAIALLIIVVGLLLTGLVISGFWLLAGLIAKKITDRIPLPNSVVRILVTLVVTVGLFIVIANLFLYVDNAISVSKFGANFDIGTVVAYPGHPVSSEVDKYIATTKVIGTRDGRPTVTVSIETPSGKLIELPETYSSDHGNKISVSWWYPHNILFVEAYEGKFVYIFEGNEWQRYDLSVNAPQCEAQKEIFKKYKGSVMNLSSVMSCEEE